jgi:hypothetical protein
MVGNLQTRRGFPALLVISLAAVIFLCGSVARASAACPSVMFIGAAGSGELDDKDQAKRFHQMGPEVYRMSSVLKTILENEHLKVGRLPVIYPAASVNVLSPSASELASLYFGGVGTAIALARYKHSHLDRYLASINDGIKRTVELAETVVANCPGTSLVMAGYSQGAMVIHKAQQRLQAAGRADVIVKIAGTLLLGDGDRVAWSRATRFGNSDARGQGVRTYLTPGKGTDVVLPQSTASICNADDIVCDFNGGTLGHVGRSKSTHTTYAVDSKRGFTFSPLLGQAASWVARLITPKLGQVVFDGSPGTGPPPAALGPYSMTPFGVDPQPHGEVTGVDGPTGRVLFTYPLTHHEVADGWETWSNGYIGDVYMSDDVNFATVQLPADTRAFYLYAEPNLFQDFNVTATSADGTSSGAVTVYGDSGARYFGFYTTGGRRLSEITVTADDVVAIGEFAISR